MGIIVEVVDAPLDRGLARIYFLLAKHVGVERLVHLHIERCHYGSFIVCLLHRNGATIDDRLEVELCHVGVVIFLGSDAITDLEACVENRRIADACNASLRSVIHTVLGRVA